MTEWHWLITFWEPSKGNNYTIALYLNGLIMWQCRLNLNVKYSDFLVFGCTVIGSPLCCIILIVCYFDLVPAGLRQVWVLVSFAKGDQVSREHRQALQWRLQGRRLPWLPHHIAGCGKLRLPAQFLQGNELSTVRAQNPNAQNRMPFQIRTFLKLVQNLYIRYHRCLYRYL